MTYLFAFVLAFAIATLATPAVRALAPLLGRLDRLPSSRNVHKTPIPRIGGLAIICGFYAPLAGLFIYVNDISALFVHNRPLLIGLFGGGLGITTLGFLDDLYGVRASVKLLGQTCVAILLWEYGFQIHSLAAIPLGPASLPVTVLWIVGIINAFNLIDGLDGLAGGVAAIAIGLNFAIAFSRPDILMCLFMASLGGAVIGFLLYNFNPATIFMGDSGSMFLGFILACTSVVSSQKTSAAASMLVPIVGLGLPIADTLLAMIRRSLRGRSIFAADREHIHHRLLDLGMTHRQAVLTLYGFCLLLAVMALGLTYTGGSTSYVLIFLAGLLILFALRRLGYLELSPTSARRNAELRARNLSLRGLVRDSTRWLHEADRVELVWDAVKFLAPALAAREMRMSVVVQQDVGEEIRSVHTWRDPDREESAVNECVLTLPLLPAGSVRSLRTIGDIVVIWADGRREVNRDDEIALEILRGHVEEALSRLVSAGSLHAQPPAPVGQVIELRRRREG